MEPLIPYLPMDRCQALAIGTRLPAAATGAALFADIAGFTALTERLVATLGPQRGADELTGLLNGLYTPLIAEIERYGGSVVSFSGDAITCWFDDAPPGLAAPRAPAPARALAAALAMQAVLATVEIPALPARRPLDVAMKIGIAAGRARRYAAGGPPGQRLDVLAGPAVDAMAAAERQARRGEVLIDSSTARALAGQIAIQEWRAAERGTFAVVEGLTAPVPPAPWPALPALRPALLRPWLLPAVWSRVRGGAGAFLAEIRPVVALFLCFSGLDYEHDPHLGRRLDRYIRWVQQVLDDHGGVLLDLNIGDKGSYLYASFGALAAHGDDARRACAAALVLRATPPECAFITGVQIGLHQGPAWAGAYGSPTRRTYSALGAVVNLAARLMEAAPPGGILASATLPQATGTGFRWAARPALAVKGKVEPVAVVQLLAASVEAGPDLLEPVYHTPLVGRRAEQAALAEAVAAVGGGAGRIVAITGEAGLGKSRLLAAGVTQARAAGFGVYAGAAQSYATQSPYLIWRTLGRGLFGIDPEAAVPEAIAAARAMLAALDPALADRLPLLGPVLGLPIADTPLTAALTGPLRTASLAALLSDCLRAWGRVAPLALVFEDCHWLDAASADLLIALGRALAGSPVLLLLTSRPPDDARTPLHALESLPHYRALPLDGLTAEEAHALAANRPTGRRLPPDLLTQIVERAEGNPFYLEELLAYVAEQPAAQRDPTHPSIAWPDNLQRLLLARIDLLTESQRRVLKTASIIGRLFRVSHLWGVNPDLGPAARVRTDLATLDRQGLTPLETAAPETMYLFKHASILEVTYAGLPPTLRATLHGQYAAWLETCGDLDPAERLDLLAYHYGQSTNRDKQREYYRQAGDAAAARYANDTAAHYYDLLLALLDPAAQGPVWLALGAVLNRLGTWPRAARAYTQALALATDPAQAASAQEGLGVALNYQRHLPEARQALDAARAGYAALGDPAGESRALRELGRVLRRMDAFSEADQVLEQSVEVARRAGNPEELAPALGDLADAVAYRGDMARAQALLDEALALQQALRNPAGMAAVMNALGRLAYDRGDGPTTYACYNQELALRRQLGDNAGIAAALMRVGISFSMQGDYPAAREAGKQGLRIARELGDQSLIAGLLNNLADVAMSLEDYAEAQALQDASAAIYAAIGSRSGVAFTYLGRGQVALLRGDDAAARVYYREALRRYIDLGRIYYLSEVGALVGLAVVAAADASPAGAAQFARWWGLVERSLAEHEGALESTEQRIVAATATQAEALLGAEAYAAARADGARLDWDATILALVADAG
jgi:class 3 adenylate cyclase/tetratricopeptide (TPR) repeat protein